MPAKTPRDLVQIGSYLRQDQAEERGLVLLAFGFPYWIIEEEGLFGLYVAAPDAEPATRELEKFEAERATEREIAREALTHPPPPAPLRKKVKPFSLFIFTWTLCICFAVQHDQGAHWITLGEADSNAILQGEIWRTLTALTLHADLGHLCANLATGLLFAWALLPLFGTGGTWMGIVLSGALGNLLNAVLHGGSEHRSIGASTAVFGGLGMLVGWQIVAAIRRHHESRDHPWRFRNIAFPLAAGLALLAFLGVGSENEHIDIMAHGLGLFSGILLGILATWTRLPEKMSPRMQLLLALAALLLPGMAWLVAIS